MLVLSREEGQEIVVGPVDAPLVVFRITSIREDKVRVAIETRDPRMPVHRREIQQAIAAEERRAREAAGAGIGGIPPVGGAVDTTVENGGEPVGNARVTDTLRGAGGTPPVGNSHATDRHRQATHTTSTGGGDSRDRPGGLV